MEFEPLEPRMLMSADLVGSVHLDAIVAPLIPGDSAPATVVVENQGSSATGKAATISVYASLDGVLDGSDTLLGSVKTKPKIGAGDSQTLHLNLDFTSALAPGHYSLLTFVDSGGKVAESNEANNISQGPAFDFAWMFGDVPGHHASDRLTLRDADGTKVNFSLLGPGTGEVTLNGSALDLQVTGTSSNSVLSILAGGGGDRHADLNDIHVAGPLGALLAPQMDLAGTLAFDGPLGAGMLIGSATNATIAAPTILGVDVLGLSVRGIAVLGDLTHSQILIGADLGADGKLGGSGANADTFTGGQLGDLLITGAMVSSQVRVGQDPVDGVFDNGNDRFYGGTDSSIRSITVLGTMSADSLFVAGAFPAKATVHGSRIDTASDPRFVIGRNEIVEPSVTIDQAPSQADPTGASPIAFAVHFSELVTGFGPDDISFAGSTVGGTLVATVNGSGADYEVDVSGMLGSGVVVASVAAGAAQDSGGHASRASTSTDNSVSYVDAVPTVTIDQAPSQADPTSASPILFAVHFSEAVAGFAAEDVSFAGSTVGGTLAATVSGGGADYEVAVSGMMGDGVVVASVVAGAATDAAGQASLASASADNAVTFVGNTAPVAVNDSFSVDEDHTLTVAAPGVLGNDTDVDSTTLTALLASGPTNGTLTLNADGSFSYAPNQNFNGSDSFTYKANDGQLDSNLATVSLTVNAVNDAPVLDFIPDKLSLVNLQLRVQASATDVDTPPSGLTYSLVGSVPTGATIDSGTGLFTWTSDMFGTTPFTVRVTDDGGLYDQKTFNVTVVPKPFIALDDVMVVEGDTGTTNAVFRVILSNPAPEQGVSVDYGKTSGPAVVGSVTGTVHFAPGETLETFAVPIQNNTTADGDRLFSYALTPGTLVNASASDKLTGTGMVMDNDTSGVLHVGIDGFWHKGRHPRRFSIPRN